MLIGQLLGLPAALGTKELWAYILLSVAVPGLVQLLLLQPMLLESPRWLLMVGRDYAAQRALAQLRGCDPDEPEDELCVARCTRTNRTTRLTHHWADAPLG